MPKTSTTAESTHGSMLLRIAACRALAESPTGSGGRGGGADGTGLGVGCSGGIENRGGGGSWYIATCCVDASAGLGRGAFGVCDCLSFTDGGGGGSLTSSANFVGASDASTIGGGFTGSCD